jgi:hypothetical protein
MKISARNAFKGNRLLSNDGWFFTAPELVSNVGRVEEVVKTVACEQEGEVFVESAFDHSTLNLVARADHVGQDVPHRMTREHRRIHVSFFSHHRHPRVIRGELHQFVIRDV